MKPLPLAGAVAMSAALLLTGCAKTSTADQTTTGSTTTDTTQAAGTTSGADATATTAPVVTSTAAAGEASVSSSSGNPIGASFGTRDPVSCVASSEPRSGPPSAELAAQYFQCEAESVNDSFVSLVTDVKVSVDAPRPFSFTEDSGGTIDQTSLVYPIHGSFRKWVCAHIGSLPAGKNCSYTDETEATGACRRLTSGKWTCSMVDIKRNSLSVDKVPGPQ